MIGLFIGSFNPPTLAHLEICLKLKDTFQKIVFVPVNTPKKHLVSLMDRVHMLDIYCQKYPFLEVNDIMENYSSFNYRILDLLKKEYGQVAIIMGDDILDSLDTFEQRDYLLTNYSFYVLQRKYSKLEEIIQTKYQKYQQQFKVIPFHNLISSSMVRKLLKKKEFNPDFLDEQIILYIKKQKLYV